MGKMKVAIMCFLILLIIVCITFFLTNNKTTEKYEWYASGNAPYLYPAELFFGDFIFSDKKRLYIPESCPFESTWGTAGSMHILGDNMFPVPESIDIIWLSFVENQFYSLQAALPKEKIVGLFTEINEEKQKPRYNYIVAGMAPYGGLAIWLFGEGISTEVAWLQAEPTDVEMKDFAPDCRKSRNEYVEKVLKNCERAYENFQKNGLPDRMLFERYMQKFNYRITPKFENEEAVFTGIRLYYYSGEFNWNSTGEHAFNAMRAKPYKIVIDWSIGKTKYGGYFWTDEKKIIETFANFYGDDTQKESNLVIEIGKSNDQFKIFLQEDDTMVELPVNDVQIMVFKNKYESFRSDNYDRPPGTWMD